MTDTVVVKGNETRRKTPEQNREMQQYSVPPTKLRAPTGSYRSSIINMYEA